jgi:hypothetical protein
VKSHTSVAAWIVSGSLVVLGAACGSSAGSDLIGPSGDGGPSDDSGANGLPPPGGDGGPGTSGDGAPNSADGPPVSPCDVVPAADGLTLHVNPIDGDDAIATGSGTLAGAAHAACAFRSITAAAAAAGSAAKKGMNVVIDVTATASTTTKEVFPILVPGDTTIAPAAGGVTVTVEAAAGDAFRMAAASATLRGLVLDGKGSGSHGVVVSGGSQTAANVLSGVEVKGFLTAGVVASGAGTLTITASTNLHDNGVGLTATDTAFVVVDGAGATEQSPTVFAKNAGSGIEVRGQARVNLTGTRSPLTPSVGTVMVKGNTGDGVLVEQLLVAAAAARPTGMTMTGLVTTQNGGSGMHVFGGSGVKVRGSYLSANGVHGLHVQTDPAFVGGGAGANDGNEMSRIDLGVAGDAGHNVLAETGGANAKKGVCFAASSGNGVGGLLKLEGNVFVSGGSSVDCSQVGAALPATGDCDAAGPLGDVGGNPKNDFDVASCSVP